MSQLNFSSSVSIIQNIDYAANSDNSAPTYKIQFYTNFFVKVAYLSLRQ